LPDTYAPAERRLLQRLNTPARIQTFLECDIAYNTEPGGATCYSPCTVLRQRVAHCMEGALFAAAALRMHGHPPLLVDLEATRDTDHVLAVFRENGRWGAVGKSNFSGLGFREPIYRTVRELAMSYFELYFNLRREKTLRAYSRPVSLLRFDRLEWMTTTEQLWAIPNYLCEIPHTPLLPQGAEQALNRMGPRLFAAGCLGKI
jgi:hypothetical protein